MEKGTVPIWLAGFLGILFLVTAGCSSLGRRGVAEASVLPVIPRPLQVQRAKGHFVINPQTRILVRPGSAELLAVAHELAGRNGASGRI